MILLKLLELVGLVAAGIGIVWLYATLIVGDSNPKAIIGEANEKLVEPVRRGLIHRAERRAHK